MTKDLMKHGASDDDRHVDDPEIIDVEDAEVIGGRPAPVPWWKRFYSRLVNAAIVGVLGVVMTAAGVFLTMTIFLAPLGIPLVLAGLLCCLFALLIAFGKVQSMVVHSGNPFGPAGPFGTGGPGDLDSN